MSGREIYTLLSLLEAERDFPATAGTGPVLTHRGRLGPFGVSVFKKHPKIGKSEYYWEKKTCFFFLPTPSRMQPKPKNSTSGFGAGRVWGGTRSTKRPGRGAAPVGRALGVSVGGLSSSGAVHGQKAASTTGSRGCSRLAGPLLPQEQLSQGGE